MYDAALLIRCYTQHALHPFIDSESNHVRYFIKIHFINKGIDFIDLPSIIQDKSVSQSLPSYFQNAEPPIICYKYNKSIRNTIFNINKLVSHFDLIFMLILLSLEIIKIQNIYQPAGHIVTGNLKIISDARIRKIVSKGPKYRFPSYINFDKCREEIVSALNDFDNRWCKRDGALKAWKRSIFPIVGKRLKFYSQNTNFLPHKPNRPLGI